MLNRTSLPLFLLATSTLLVLSAACSSDDGEEKKGPVGPSINIDPGGNPGNPSTPGGNGTFDGGSFPVTPEQAEGIRNQACTGWTSEGEVLPSVLELVIDVSSSMNQQAPGGDGSKWEVTRDALLDAVVGVSGAGLPASVAVGLLFYPNVEAVIGAQPQDTTACVNTGAMIPIDAMGAPGAPHRTRIQRAIQDVMLQRSTPSHDAYRHALNSGLIPTTFSGQKFMLLITDGQPTLSLGCMNPSGTLSAVDPQPIVAEITEAAKKGVKTFLIGSPGSEPNRAWMSRAAVIGGTARPGCDENGPDWCHMDMTTAPSFSDALRSGLAQIAGQISPCTYAFAPPPSGETLDPAKINVLTTTSGQTEVIVRDDVGDCNEGWQLTADQQILLCPATCDRVQADPHIGVEVMFGCGSISEPIR